MALIPCKECGNQISDKAKGTCPHCGVSLISKADRVALLTLSGGCGVIIFVVLFIIIVIALIIFVGL